MVQIKLLDDRFFAVSFNYDPLLIQKIKLCGGVWNPVNRYWCLPLSAYPSFKSVFGRHDVLEARYYELKSKEEQEIREKWDKVKNGILPDKFKTLSLKIQPLAYQKTGISFLYHFKKALLNFDLGLGKTFISIVASLLECGEDDKVLIVCPSSLKYSWANEIEKFTDEKYVIVEGDRAKRKNLYHANVKFIITSYELVRLGYDIDIIRKLKWKVLILDEATRFKNFKTKTNKNLRKIKSLNIYGLTGCAVENRITDLYGIMKVINSKILGLWKDFKNNYLIIRLQTYDGTNYFEEIVGYKNLEKLKEDFKRFLYKLEKREVLKELPPRQDLIYKIEMSESQSRLHSAISNKIDEGYNPLAVISELRQVVNFPEQIGYDVESAKFNELVKILEDIDDKVIIFTFYVKSMKILERKLGEIFKQRKIFIVSGELSDKEKQDVINKFKESEKGSILISTDCLAYGQNLQFCNIIINYDLQWNPIVMENRIGRIDRLGQRNPVFVIYLITKNSVEERIWKILSEKKELIDKLMELNKAIKVEYVDKKFLAWLLKGGEYGCD